MHTCACTYSLIIIIIYNIIRALHEFTLVVRIPRNTARGQKIFHDVIIIWSTVIYRVLLEVFGQAYSGVCFQLKHIGRYKIWTRKFIRSVQNNNDCFTMINNSTQNVTIIICYNIKVIIVIGNCETCLYNLILKRHFKHSFKFHTYTYNNRL